MSIASELLVVLALVLANGLFAGAEIAILSVRKTRLQELAHEGKRSALELVRMRAEPERFLATVQIGITVIGATAGAFGGHTLARAVASLLEGAGVTPATAEDVALVLVVIVLSFLSLVIGELVPKSLALRSAERYALLIARPMGLLSWLARPVVWFLTASSNLILRLFRDRTTFTETRLSKEELQQLVDEATTVGALDRATGNIAYRALDFGDVRVGALIVPRPDMVTLAHDASREKIADTLVNHGYARIPIRKGDAPEDILGYVTSRDLVRIVVGDEPHALVDVMRPALFVPETRRAVDVLSDMQATRDHLALVVDAQGTVGGLVTLEDLLEELVGEIFAEHDTPVDRIRRDADGIVVRGLVAVHEVNRELGLELPEGDDYTTMGGLVTALAGAIPSVGACIEAPGVATLHVLEASERRVSSIRVVPITDAAHAHRR